MLKVWFNLLNNENNSQPFLEWENTIKKHYWGWPGGVVVRFMCSTSVAWGLQVQIDPSSLASTSYFLLLCLFFVFFLNYVVQICV